MAKFKRYTYNGVTVQATGRRSSDRPNKAWVRTVRRGDSERKVHYADPDMPMRRTNPEARRNFLSRHNCGAKRDPFAPGFWACYDWANPSEKEVDGMDKVGVAVKIDGKDEFVQDAQEIESAIGGIADKAKDAAGQMDKMYGAAPMEECASAAYVPGATSFAELHAAEMADEAAKTVHELTAQFQMLTTNIMMDETVEDKSAAIAALAGEYSELVSGVMSESKSRWQPLTDRLQNMVADRSKAKPMKTEGGVKYPASDYAYTPDKERPSGWKLRMSEGNPGNVTRSQLGRAAAALSPSGFRGQRVEIPAADLPAVKRKLRAEYAKLGVEREDMPPAVKMRSGLMVWKDASTDKYRFLAIYSNNYRDRDNPPEILSAKAHQDFVAAVDAGEWPYPELWLWHEPGTKCGQCDMVHYDKDTGFALAAGHFDDGKEHVALNLARSESLVSHGMPIGEIERDDKDQTILTRYRTKEISPLPPDAAANYLTGLQIVQEVKSMNIPDHKQAFIGGIDPDALQADLEDRKAQAEGDALESKEADAPEQEAKEETPAVEAEAPQEPAATPDLAAQLGAVMGAALQEALAPIAARLDALENKEAEAEPEPEPAPEPMTVAGAFIQAMKEASAIGAPEARVDGRSKLAKDAPAEFESKTGPLNSGDAFLDGMLNPILTGKFQEQMRRQIGVDD